MNQVLPVVPDLSWLAFGFAVPEDDFSEDDDLAFLLQALARAEAQQRRLVAQSQHEDGAALQEFYASAIARIAALVTEIELCIQTMARRPHPGFVSALAA